MLTIIFTLVVSLIVAFIATQNATLVTLRLGGATFADTPLFFVVLVSILVGTLVASIVSLINLIQSKLTIFGQKNALNKSHQTVEQLQQRVGQLEEENTTLKDQIKEISPVDKS